MVKKPLKVVKDLGVEDIDWVEFGARVELILIIKVRKRIRRLLKKRKKFWLG